MKLASIHSTRLRLVLGSVLLLVTPAAAEGDSKGPRYPPARGFGYLGGFFVTNVETTLSAFSGDLPLGVRLDLNRDLGFSDSSSSPRATLGWRFGQRHLLTGGWYRLQRDSRKTLGITIPLPPGDEFPIDAEVESELDFDLYKLQYTWLFHRDEKVSLGLGAGLFVAGIRFKLEGLGPFDEQRFDQSFTAPLPVAGFRLLYRLTPRANVTATGDWFFIRYQDSRGVLGDLLVFFQHRTFKHVGFAGGLNLWTQKVDYVSDDFLIELDESYVGFLAAVTFHF